MSAERAAAIRAMVREAVVEALGRTSEAEPKTELPTTAAPDAVTPPTPPREYYSPWIGTAYEAHPSQHRLVEIGQASSPWPTAVGQPCPLEPRPCDDCGRCRSLGF
ncbi:MAG: hypothetical protein EBZ36_04675 [Acidobacteria bacterium]|jgi:hypothetical protein|nr:hypothetical protein [Acidobacteriota bacterium]